MLRFERSTNDLAEVTGAIGLASLASAVAMWQSAGKVHTAVSIDQIATNPH
jgi:hypothetical protein